MAAGIRFSYVKSHLELPHVPVLVLKSIATSKHQLEATVTTISNLYTNPAQRSSAVTKSTHIIPDRPAQASKEPVVNGHLVSHSNPRQCSTKTVALTSLSGTNTCDSQKVATSGKPVKVTCKRNSTRCSIRHLATYLDSHHLTLHVKVHVAKVGEECQ
ncbi:hypothetical protein O3P69_008063 [Scylla paramamosain]|uniref:C2H2-type domain-containing protein n=1 Tax=Scylla paramamosain TaxID=85552 RepID=A0AAW0T101_SCYPA